MVMRVLPVRPNERIDIAVAQDAMLETMSLYPRWLKTVVWVQHPGSFMTNRSILCQICRAQAWRTQAHRPQAGRRDSS